MRDILIQNALVIPMTEARRSFNGYVRVMDGVIQEVGDGVAGAAPGGAEVIDAPAAS